MSHRTLDIDGHVYHCVPTIVIQLGSTIIAIGVHGRDGFLSRQNRSSDGLSPLSQSLTGDNGEARIAFFCETPERRVRLKLYEAVRGSRVKLYEAVRGSRLKLDREWVPRSRPPGKGSLMGKGALMGSRAGFEKRRDNGTASLICNLRQLVRCGRNR
jgi:hypothetical protein